ncbi:MAG: sensor histidine kinase [Poseidonibacter sp.]|uniref:sensor histidine kinase n=1 Tax=Poseidonibacter sp. TaxID=2321188 RepID=UPI00359D6FA5
MIDKIKAHYIFNIVSIIVLFSTLIIYSLFVQTKKNVEEINMNSHLDYIDNITNNISNLIKQSTNQTIYKSLKNDEVLRKNIEKSIEVFITNRYRYIYVLDKEDEKNDVFRFLLDGEKKLSERSDFLEEYTPSNIKDLNEVYKTKKPLYFKHKDIKTLWITYLKPIIIDDKVQAVIVVDFSLETHDKIIETLNNLDDSLKVILYFSFILFIVILIFAYLDKKREDSKLALFNKLKYTNKELKEKTKEVKNKSQKIIEFNKTLEETIKNEVAKNRQKDKQIIEQSRLAQMGQMLSMIAHQWRQPLSAISSTSNALNLKAQLGKLDNQTAVTLAKNISVYAEHLSLTINDFRDFFKSNKEKQETNFSELIRVVLTIIEISIKNKGIKLIKKLECEDSFYSYPNELKQVLLNILQNSEDVLIQRSIKNPYIEINTYKKGKKMIIEVKDNGGGILSENIDKIFDPYFSTKIKKDGTGLGLYMSKMIISEHCNGKLIVSNDSEGAVFRIILNKDKEDKCQED